jgi:general secretion pathway protein D
MIMATVAEVTLDDSEQFGFNWLLRQLSQGGYNIRAGLGSAPTGSATGAGLSLNFATIGGDPRAALTALASSNRVRVLSNPSIVTMSGYNATIQVGQDVPIVTSQVSNANTATAGGAGIQQTVQYRNTGIILRVKPVIFSGGRVDLEVSQEVSGVANNTSGVGNSPIVSTRKIDTRLSASDGNTMLLGGLIREQRDVGNSGVPYLKDIPIAGAAFRTGGNETTVRTELVVLLTPHIIEDDSDARAVTDAFKAQFSWAKPGAEGILDRLTRPFDSPVGAVKRQPAAIPSTPATAPTSAVDPVQPSVSSPRGAPLRAPTSAPVMTTPKQAVPPGSSRIQVPSSAPTESAKPVAASDNQPLVVPAAQQPSASSAPAVPNRFAASKPVSAASRVAPASAPRKTSPASASRPAAPGQPVTDANLLNELMEAVRKGK